MSKDNTPDENWDTLKVGTRLAKMLNRHRVFKQEPKAITIAQHWLSAIDAAMDQNGRNPVAWNWKDIQNRFRSCRKSYTVFRDALQYLGLIKFFKSANDGASGKKLMFALKPDWREWVAEGNHAWLSALLARGDIRRKNQIAASKRKQTRIIHGDSIKRIIADFNNNVTFERLWLLERLGNDREKNIGRFCSVLHHLLAIETRKFSELTMNGGRIHNDFAVLPLEYRTCAKFRRKVYVAKVLAKFVHKATNSGIIESEGPLLFDPEIYEYPESLGLTFAYEYDGIGIFGKLGDPELPAKLEKAEAFIRHKAEQRFGANMAIEVRRVVFTIRKAYRRLYDKDLGPCA